MVVQHNVMCSTDPIIGKAFWSALLVGNEHAKSSFLNLFRDESRNSESGIRIFLDHAPVSPSSRLESKHHSRIQDQVLDILLVLSSRGGSTDLTVSITDVGIGCKTRAQVTNINASVIHDERLSCNTATCCSQSRDYSGTRVSHASGTSTIHVDSTAGDSEQRRCTSCG